MEDLAEVEVPRFDGPAQGLRQEIVLAAIVAGRVPYLPATGAESAAPAVGEPVESVVSVAAVSEFAYAAAVHLHTSVSSGLVQHHGT